MSSIGPTVENTEVATKINRRLAERTKVEGSCVKGRRTTQPRTGEESAQERHRPNFIAQFSGRPVGGAARFNNPALMDRTW
jgi:hypothetical protein